MTAGCAAGAQPEGWSSGSAGAGAGASPAVTGLTLEASVTYPFLIPDPHRPVDYFPTVFAHLLGQPLTWGDISTSFACITLTNQNTESVQATVRVELTGYSIPLKQTVVVDATSTSTACVNPTPTLSALYALTAPVPGQVHATVTQAGTDSPVLDDVHAVTITTASTVFNGRAEDGRYVALNKYQAVVAMPKDPAVQALLTPTAQRSAWGTFGVGGYDMHVDADKNPMPRNPTTTTLTIGGSQVESVYFTAGESVQVQIDDVECALCEDKSIDFYALSATDYQKVQSFGWADLAPAIVRAPGSVAHKAITVTAPSDGRYYLSFRNGSRELASRTVTYHRTGTKADTAIDALHAVYDELQSWGISYVNIDDSFFDAPSAQSVRWPATVLHDHAANCLDGSLLFASILEAIQLEPVVVIVPGHAFVGVRQEPGGPVLWPVETTMLATASFFDAFNEGLAENQDENLPHVAEIDIKAARAAGLTPIPE